MSEPEMESDEMPIPRLVLGALLGALGLGFLLGWIAHAMVVAW